MRLNRILGLVLGVAAAAATSVATAAPIALLIDPAQSTLTIGIDGGGALGNGSGAGTASGNINGDLTGNTFTLGANSIAVSDITTAGTGLLGVLIINGVVSNLSNPNPIVGVGDVFDLSGSDLTLTSGIVVIPALGNLTAFDFSTAPTSLTLGSVLATLSGGVLTVPVQAQVTFSTLNSVVTVTVSGDIVAAIPEPGTMLLMGAGLAGLAAAARKRA